MAYHMLFTKENGKWHPQFGDHVKSVVSQEAKDCYFHVKVNDRHIAKLPSAHQRHVDEYQKKLNSVNEAEVTKSLLTTWPRPEGEANFAATNYHKNSPSNKFLLPDNGVFKVMTKVFNRGANRYGYNQIQSIKKMDHVNPKYEQGIGEGVDDDVKKVIGHTRKGFNNINRNSYTRKKLKFFDFFNAQNPSVTIPIKNESELHEMSHEKLKGYLKASINDALGLKRPRLDGNTPPKVIDKARRDKFRAKAQSKLGEGEVAYIRDNPKYKSKISFATLQAKNRSALKTLDFSKRMGYALPKPKAVNELSNDVLGRYAKKAKVGLSGYGGKEFNRNRYKGISSAEEIMKDRKHPINPKVHDLTHLSHGEAYDHTQTSDHIKDGDVLKVKGGVAIMYKAWPTMHHGDSEHLHSLKDGSSFEKNFRGRYKKSAELANSLRDKK